MNVLFLSQILLSQTLASQEDGIQIENTEIQEEHEKLHISSHLTIKVQKKEMVADQMVKKAKDMGGYYASRTEQKIHLKIPTSQAIDFIDSITQQGLIVERELNSQSVHQDITDLQARLKTREELLSRYFDILNNAKGSNVLTVERAVIDLVSEIEGLEGKLRRQEHVARFADIYVSFQYRERRAPVNDGSSSFEWLNSLNVQDVQYGFQYSEDTTRKKSFGSVPKDFAIYEKSKDLRSASHDGILYRIRTIRPEQNADIPFWSEAVSNRMHAAGYHPYVATSESKKITSEPLDNGVLITCLAASGEHDLAYWIAFSKRGKDIILIEATGEISKFQTYEKDIRQAIEESFLEL